MVINCLSTDNNILTTVLELMTQHAKNNSDNSSHSNRKTKDKIRFNWNEETNRVMALDVAQLMSEIINMKSKKQSYWGFKVRSSSNWLVARRLWLMGLQTNNQVIIDYFLCERMLKSMLTEIMQRKNAVLTRRSW